MYKLPRFALVVLLIISSGCGSIATKENVTEVSSPKKKIVFIAGKDSHAKGEHEHEAGVALLAKCLERGLDNVEVSVTLGGWPEDKTVLAGADTIVIYCDGGEKHHVANHNLEALDGILDAGTGIVCIHYAVEVAKGSESSKRLLRGIGGYFETDYSVNPHWRADFKTLPTHPITRGVKPFEMKDEWYFNMRFQDDMKGVTPILSAVPDESTMNRKDGARSGNHAVRAMVKAKQTQHVAWAYERPDGGRGFGFTGGHFHKNWDNDDFRKTILNAIAWTAHIEVPNEGVETVVYIGRSVEQQEDVEVPLDRFAVPDDLEITLWAQSPLFYNPTNMDVDLKGRIWVAEGRNYRKFASRGISKVDEKGDRIVVVYDSNGDGKADDSHVFVQDPELVAPLGVAVVDNQIVVSQPPNLIVYTDVNRDLVFDPKVDKRENLLTGFSGLDHDHSLHSLTVGPDGKWYFNIGNAGTGSITDKSGKTFRIGSFYRDKELGGLKSDDGHVYVSGAAFRMNPDGTDLEVIGFGLRNSYEQTINSLGDVYNNDNDDPPNCRTTWLMEHGNLGYASVENGGAWPRDKRPGQTKQIAHWRQEDPGVIPAGDVYGVGSPTGITFYENGALPKKYIGTLLSAEPAQNVIFGYNPEVLGAGYELADNRFDFVTTNTEKVFDGVDGKRTHGMGDLKTLFRPSDVLVGPDGAIYVSDWFDARVGGHTALDKKHTGNIYRIAPKKFESKIPTVDYTSIKGLINALKSPATNVRGTAAMKLAEMGPKAFSAVKELLKHENPYIKARALWLLPHLGAEGLSIVDAHLKDKDAQVRIAAYRALQRVNKHMSHAAKLAKDTSPAVRREIALSLRDVSFDKSESMLIDIAKAHDGKDRWYLEALGTGATFHEAKLYAALDKIIGGPALKWDARFADIAWRLHPPAALDAFAARAKSESIDEKERIRMLTAIAFTPGLKAADAMLELSMMGSTEKNTKVIEMAKWWISHPHYDAWREYDKFKKFFAPTKIAKDYLVPTTFGAATNLPDAKEILALKGDAAKGSMLIARCAMCHEVNDTFGGTDFGPNIATFGQTQTRGVLLTALLNPSADIAHAYDGYEVTMKNGKRIQGLPYSSTDKTITMKLFGGGLLTFAKSEVAKNGNQKMLKSLMPSASQMGLSAQEVRDIVEYLKTSSSK
jgi:putative membrane-bound dehydrogenase-like protein